MDKDDAVNIPAMKIALMNMIESLPVMIEFARIDAKLKREKFNALIAEGFTEQQAIEIIK